MTVQELQQQCDQALSKADRLVSVVESQKRQLTSAEQQIFDGYMRDVAQAKAAKERIATARPTATRNPAEARALIAQHPRLPSIDRLPSGNGLTPLIPAKFSREYLTGFHSWVGGSGPLSASLVEGTNNAGGYAIPVVVDGHVVPLAPQDSAVRRLSTTISTQSDIHTPQVMVGATVAAKSETSSFAISAPTLGQFTLSAFAAGVETQTSLEFAQDVFLFRTFCLDDAVRAFQEYEESLFISGTGSGQAQGLIGNVGSGVTEEPDGLGNLISIQGTLDLIGTLKATYDANASWLMQKATALLIRKAQVGANLFEPVFRRENGVDLLHGYKVEYSSAMPTAARGATPILFGDFASGYLIGDRGGPALILKVLDQANAAQGLVDLLFFRRTDGRVRRSEAIQQYNIAAS